jgi:hypothetical protein
MIVPVNCRCGSCPEWLMVELQGELSLKDAETMGAEGFDVGVMCLKVQFRPKNINIENIY